MKMFKKLWFRKALDKQFFYLPKQHLRAMGFDELNPGFSTSNTSTWNLRYFFILTLGLISHWNGGCFANCTDIIEVFSQLCPLLTATVILLKGCILRYHYKHLQQLIQQQFHLLFNIEHEIEGNINRNPKGAREGTKRQLKDSYNTNFFKRNRIIRDFMIAGNIMNILTLIMNCSTLFLYILNPLIDVLQQWYNDQDIIWNLPLQLGLPRFMMERPMFPLAYAFTSYYGFLVISTIGCSDGIYMEFCAHTSSLFKLLQMDLREIFNTVENRLKLGAEELRHIEMELIQIIQRHLVLMDLFNKFRKIYTVIILLHFISASVVIGMSIFNMLSVAGFAKMTYFCYTFAVLFQLATYCYGGSLIAENSTNLALAISCSNWDIYKPRLRTLLIMIIMRAQKPLMMKVPFFSITLATFTSILRASGSLITFALSFR